MRSVFSLFLLTLLYCNSNAQLLKKNLNKKFNNAHPRIYVNNTNANRLRSKIKNVAWAHQIYEDIKKDVTPYVNHYKNDSTWLVSRLQMYWNTHYKNIYLKGMYYDHGSGHAPVPTVRFDGSRDWATDYMVPKIKNIKPYMDNSKGLFLQNKKKKGHPWEWVKPNKTGLMIHEINYDILSIAEKAAFLYWYTHKKIYARFASGILLTYMKGIYYRNPPRFLNNSHNRFLVGLQTFEVIHENVIVPLTVGYDFLYSYLKKNPHNIKMFQSVFKKWAHQEVIHGVPYNNWDLFQARYITYLALAMESNSNYADHKGREYYINLILNKNLPYQRSLRSVLKNYDNKTGLWNESSGYSINVSKTILRIFTLIDNYYNDNILKKFPIMEKAVLATAQYLYPNDFTASFGDSHNNRPPTQSMEMLIALNRKYKNSVNPKTAKSVIKYLSYQTKKAGYNRSHFQGLFPMFFYVDNLSEMKSPSTIKPFVTPTFYSSNVSFFVQRNGYSAKNGLMISEFASLGNHSHANGIAMGLYGKGIVVSPGSSRGSSYWQPDFTQYYSRFPGQNTVIVDGKSDYHTMMGKYPFKLLSCYPKPGIKNQLLPKVTYSDVYFNEPKTNADQNRFMSTVRTSDSTGYYVDIFRSRRRNRKDKMNDYIYHSLGHSIEIYEPNGKRIHLKKTDILSTEKNILKGYTYFKNEHSTLYNHNFFANFEIDKFKGNQINMRMWMIGYPQRRIFAVEAPPTRAIIEGSAPSNLKGIPMPTIIVRQKGEAWYRPFVTIYEPYIGKNGPSIKSIKTFKPKNAPSGFVGLNIESPELKTNQYIFEESSKSSEIAYKNNHFEGPYGIISIKGNTFNYLFLGNGKRLIHGNWGIEADKGDINAAIIRNNNSLYLKSDGSFKLLTPLNKSSKSHKYKLRIKNSNGEIKSFNGHFREIDGIKYEVYELPAMKLSKILL